MRDQRGDKNASYRHGGYGVNRSEYISWRNMKARCLNHKNEKFPRYGAVGITVYEGWLGADGFINFLADMGKKPTQKHTIDRIDNSKGYYPNNCRWATKSQQVQNSSAARIVTLDGISSALVEHCRRYGIDPRIVATREKNMGWPLHKAITTPVVHRSAK